jgi:hypothetical protein
VYATSAQRICGVGISYSTGNRMLYAIATGNFGTHLPDNSATQVVSRMSVLSGSFQPASAIYGTDGADPPTTITPATAAAPTAALMTHIGLSAGSVYGDVGATAATFGTLTWLVQFAPPT